MGYNIEMDMFWFCYPFSLEAICRTLSDEECVALIKYGLERCKGLFQYEWLDSLDKLNEDQIPPKEAFYSNIKQTDNTDVEHEQAKRFWEESGSNTMKNYRMLSLKTDALLSVDVFDRFREHNLDYFEKDPGYTYSTPGLTWICGLKYTDARVKHYKEETVNFYDTIQKGIRVGLAWWSQPTSYTFLYCIRNVNCFLFINDN